MMPLLFALMLNQPMSSPQMIRMFGLSVFAITPLLMCATVEPRGLTSPLFRATHLNAPRQPRCPTWRDHDMRWSTPRSCPCG